MNPAGFSKANKCPKESSDWCSENNYCLSTKYEAIIDLAINLGCDYLKELEVGANARYRSHAIIGEFLKVLATVIEEEQLSCLTKSKFYSLLTDESTDISYLSFKSVDIDKLRGFASDVANVMV